MEIREAILKAADWIQEHPDSYNFMATEIPHCGSKGCLIGWVGYFLGIPEGENSWSKGCQKIMGIDLETFNNRLGEFCWENSANKNMSVWEYQTNSKQAARILTFYANRFHPAQPSIERKPEAEVCREIIARPFKESANA